MSAILGFVAFILMLCAIGALMDHDFKKAGLLGAALLLCSVFIISGDNRRSSASAGADCYTEWDMRASRTVCR